MSQEDLRINKETRKVLVQHWLDLGRLSIRTSLGKLTIRGYLEKIRGVKEELSSAVVTEIFNKIKRIKGIARITIDLDNWQNDEGSWGKIEQTTRRLLPTSSAPSRNTAYSSITNPQEEDQT